MGLVDTAFPESRCAGRRDKHGRRGFAWAFFRNGKGTFGFTTEKRIGHGKWKRRA